VILDLGPQVAKGKEELERVAIYPPGWLAGVGLLISGIWCLFR